MVLEARRELATERLQAACVLAVDAPDDGRWEGVREDLAAALVAQDALVMGRWADLLRPVRRYLLPPLADCLWTKGAARSGGASSPGSPRATPKTSRKPSTG